ncbi:MAG: tRNA (adenosine(37)-N6)-dimethylallyltransferase MiaA [Rectinemataceae bacterium]|nr:tRNA (adenosine(37)-N6)-dimethylallyltransferase MiaA [Rectinemataceae bacterium]
MARWCPSQPSRCSTSRWSIGSSAIKVIILTGPTASGKTELLDSVFARGAFSFPPVAIVSADAMQAYRCMDIGTAKPEPALLSRLPHHLIDIRDPDEQYTAGDFVHLADALCSSMADEGVLPIVAGGTGFYIRNFICGPPLSPPSSAEVRQRVAADLQSLGAEALRQELEAADPPSAARIHDNDLYRLTRAVEILRTSGFPPSQFAPSDSPRVDYEFLIVGIERPRNELKARIHARVEKMFDAGLAKEATALIRAGYHPSNPGLKAIGYREFYAMEGQPMTKIATAIELHTLQYAKRQMTFLRALPGIRWIGADPESLAAAVHSFIS